PSDWVDFYNIYGPTECTVNVSSFIVRDATPLIPIGRPNSNVRLYVLDKSDRLVPVGACGELCISGPQVFREYLNNPEKTAKTVVPNPLSDDPGHRRLYRTGDVVRLLPDGNVDYVGRRDGMVKVRGFRIELGEVEAAVRSFEGIKDATVQAFDAPSGGKLIAAYVVSDGKVDVKALGDFIASTKPAYMVPAVTMQLDEIPMTVNGKVDRRKLPAPAIDFGKVTPPSTDLQKRIFKIASDVLGTDGFGIETDLFQAGLTSISSIRLNTLLSEEFGIPFRSKDVKDNCTVEKLESFVLNSAPAKEYPVQDDYPLTKSQEGVFVECMSMPGSTVYNIPILVKCDDGIDTARLKAAIVKAVAAHPFVTTELFMSDSGDIRMRGKGLREFSEDEIEEVTADSLESVKPDLVQPFQLMGSRLFRFKIIHADGEYLLADLHHIISDGASTHILMDAISRAYAGEELEPERFSGFEAALKEEDERKGEALNVARKYYEDLLSGRDRDFLLKGDRRGPAPASDGELLAEGSVPAEELCRYCDGAGITVNAMMCSAFGHVLAAFNGNDHSVFATVYNGRSDSRIADSISMYVKTLPVVCDVSDLSMPPLRLCEAMGRQLVDSMSNDLYSFAEASRELGAKADVLFVYQGEGLSMDSFCGLPSEPVPLSLSEVKEPILFQVISDHGKIRYRVEYDKERYTPELIGSLVRAFDRALSEFMSSSKLKEVSLADESTEEAYRRLNDTDSPYDASVTALDRFRKNAKERPDATAVVHKGRSMTYGELGSAAGRIAGYVRSKGIGRNEFVAVLVHRSPGMVFAALGIEMAGAAYQPLDPTYPEERLLFMMRDAGARLLIADRALRGLVRSYDGDILYTDEIGSLPEADEFPSPAPEDAFVILYTSGTT
ncbi:MAG: AMP-binding protein, partial [Candidatus Methanomethylophilaceae archaeon]|nr:AMP-binding protein [Candidatus Methanomethylophilaceae archaeon]